MNDLDGCRYTLSYWQRGCDDARAHSLPTLPFKGRKDWEAELGNRGYLNGYRHALKMLGVDAGHIMRFIAGQL